MCRLGACSRQITVHPTVASAAGYHVLSVTSANTLPNATCALSSTFSYGRAPLFAQCTLTTSGTTLLSVYVDKTCAGAVLQACADC